MSETTFAVTVVTHVQSVAIIGYCSLAAEFFYRYKWDRPLRRSAVMSSELFRGTTDKRLNRMLQAMLVMTIFIMIRSVFLLSLCAATS